MFGQNRPRQFVLGYNTVGVFKQIAQDLEISRATRCVPRIATLRCAQSRAYILRNETSRGRAMTHCRPLHGDACGIADLDPDAARAGLVGAIDLRRYDALGAKRARDRRADTAAVSAIAGG
jgi:hypothetical protein